MLGEFNVERRKIGAPNFIEFISTEEQTVNDDRSTRIEPMANYWNSLKCADNFDTMRSSSLISECLVVLLPSGVLAYWHEIIQH